MSSGSLTDKCERISEILDELPQDVWDEHYEDLEDIREFVTEIDEQLADEKPVAGDDRQRLKHYYKQVKKLGKQAGLDI